MEKNLSQIIRDRVKAAGARFHSNDNIADFINEVTHALVI